MDQGLRKDHFERRTLQSSLDEVIIQQVPLELIDGVIGLDRQVLEPDPDQEGAADSEVSLIYETDIVDQAPIGKYPRLPQLIHQVDIRVPA